MDELSQKWMTYIDAEVRAACRERGLGYQVRRKWMAREKPVSTSPVDDYEWKLIPGAEGQLPDQGPLDTGHPYYLLGLDRAGGKFILHHDNRYCGGGDEYLATFTEIRLSDPDNAVARVDPPRPGWLCDTLVLLTERFRPNWFTLT